jgi:hypothetical protein
VASGSTNAGRAGTASFGRIDLIKGGQISMNASWEVPFTSRRRN